MRPSIAARSFWSFSTSKKPPQFAGARFQILGIGDGDFSWHAQKIIQFPANRKGRDPYLCELPGFGFAARGGSRRKIVSPSFIRSEERRVGKECRSRWLPYL